MLKDFSQFLIPDGYVIYLFHGVIPEQRHKIRNYTKKHLTKDEFADQIKRLSSKGTALSMQDIVDATQSKSSLPPYSYSITFDDGFENNYSVAAPVLEEHQTPAMIYVTTGFIETNTISWIDQIELAFESIPSFVLQNPCDSSVEYQCDSVESKINALQEIRRYVKHHSSIKATDFAQECLQQLGIQEQTLDSYLDHKMSWQQVVELDRHPLFTIGGHTHTHPILSFLSQEELSDELDTSITLLTKHIEHELTHYSYPEGLAHCYNDNVIHALQSRGIICSPSAEHGINHVGDSLFHLKRIMVE